jgi:hypothetical protein
MIEITKAKNADYTGEGDDPFANFSRVELLGITDVSRGFLVRMSDKFSRIISFVQKGFLLVKDETIEDTLLDMANYCILMSGFIVSEKAKATAAHVDTLVDGALLRQTSLEMQGGVEIVETGSRDDRASGLLKRRAALGPQWVCSLCSATNPVTRHVCICEKTRRDPFVSPANLPVSGMDT